MTTSDRKARIAEVEWERHKKRILDLYLTRDLTLKELVEEMRGQLDASASQFEAQLRAWNARKNLKTFEWKAVFNIIDKLPRGKRTRVTISGHPISDRKIHRARRNYMRQSEVRKRRRLDDGLGGDITHAPLDIGQVSIQTLESDGTWSTLPSPHDAESAGRKQKNESFPALQNQGNPHSREIDMSDFDGINFPESKSIVPSFQESTALLSQVQDGEDYEVQLHIEEQVTSLSTIGSPALDWGMLAGTTPFMVLNPPRKWLEGLPSRRFGSDMNARGLRLINTNISGDVLGLASPVSSFWAQFLVDTIPLGENSCGASSQIRRLGPEFLLRTFNILMQRDDPGGHDHRDYTIISTNEIEETQFMHTIICSIINGFAGLDEIPIDRIVRFLGRFQNMQLLLAQALNACRSRAAQSLAENLLRAAIEASEAQVVSRLLSTGLLEMNAMICPYKGRKLTPIERASMLGSLSVVRTLIRYEVDVNKTYALPGFPISQGALNVFLESLENKSGVPSEWSEIASVLLKAGAKIDLAWLLNAYDNLDSSLISKMLMKSSPADHLFPIKCGHLIMIAHYFEDNRAAEHVARILEDCQQHHNRNCFINPSCDDTDRGDISNMMNLAVVIGARRGSFEFVRLLLPYCQRTKLNLVLSASIRSGRDDLIEHVLEANTKSISIDTGHIDDLLRLADQCIGHHALGLSISRRQPILRNLSISDVSNSPLAEAILARKEPLVRRFEEAGALAHLYKGSPQVRTVIAAASEIGDARYVRKLLSHCPFLEPGDLSGALYYAIQNDDEALAWELLDAGADVNESRKGCYPLDAAIERKNSQLVRAVLSADIGALPGERHLFSITLDCLVKLIRWGDRSIIIDLTTAFPRLELLIDERAAQFNRPPEDLDLIDSDFLNFLSEFICITRAELATCLAIAIRRRDNDMIKKTLERGADPSTHLEWAIYMYPSVLDIILPQIARGIQPVVNESGMPALLAAIKGGRNTIQALDNLLRSGLFNLGKRFFLEDPEYHDSAYSPLGLAIKENENHHDPNFSVIKRLLNAGCIVDSVAESPARYCYGKPVVCHTAVLLAIDTKNEDLVQLLIDHGADANAQTHLTVKQTPLQRAAEVGSLNIVRLLLNHGADINAEPAIHSGGTALQYAARSGNCTVAAELLTRGALLHASPSKVNGRWPLEGAAEYGRLDMIEFLWKAHQDTITLEPCATGFEPDRCRRAMQLANVNGHFACRNLIADLSNCTPLVANSVSSGGFCG